MNQTNYNSLDNTIDSLTSNKMYEEVKEIITETIHLALGCHFKGKFNKIPQHQAYALAPILLDLFQKVIKKYCEEYGNPKPISNIPLRSNVAPSQEEKKNYKKVRSQSNDQRNSPIVNRASKKSKKSKEFRNSSLSIAYQQSFKEETEEILLEGFQKSVYIYFKSKNVESYAEMLQLVVDWKWHKDLIQIFDREIFIQLEKSKQLHKYIEVAFPKKQKKNNKKIQSQSDNQRNPLIHKISSKKSKKSKELKNSSLSIASNVTLEKQKQKKKKKDISSQPNFEKEKD